jgi:hypothetical protein
MGRARCRPRRGWPSSATPWCMTTRSACWRPCAPYEQRWALPWLRTEPTHRAGSDHHAQPGVPGEAAGADPVRGLRRAGLSAGQRQRGEHQQVGGRGADQGAGMRWARTHVNPLVALRAVACSDRWAQAWPQITVQWRAQVWAHRRDRAAVRRPAPSAAVLTEPVQGPASDGVEPARPPTPPRVAPPAQHRGPRRLTAATPGAGRPLVALAVPNSSAETWRAPAAPAHAGRMRSREQRAWEPAGPESAVR